MKITMAEVLRELAQDEGLDPREHAKAAGALDALTHPPFCKCLMCVKGRTQ